MRSIHSFVFLDGYRRHCRFRAYSRMRECLRIHLLIASSHPFQRKIERKRAIENRVPHSC